MNIQPIPVKVIETVDYDQIAEIVKRDGFMLLAPDDELFITMHSALYRKFLLGLTTVRVGGTVVAYSVQPARETARRSK